MSRTRWSLTLLFLAFAVPAGAAQDAFLIAGRVLVGEGDVVVKRADGTSVRARYPVVLHGKDRLEFHGKGKVKVNIYGTISDVTADMTIPVRDPGRHNDKDESLLTEMEIFCATMRDDIQNFSYARTGGDTSIPMPVIGESPLEPTGLAHVLASTRHVAVVWRYGAADLMTGSAAGGSFARTPAAPQAWAVVELPAQTSIISARGMNPALTLSWQVDVRPTAPQPHSLDGHTGPWSEAERLTRAYWILKHGPKAWKLFAMSEIADLAQSGNFVASDVWTAARSGELEQFWKSKAK